MENFPKQKYHSKEEFPLLFYRKWKLKVEFLVKYNPSETMDFFIWETIWIERLNVILFRYVESKISDLKKSMCSVY